MNKSTHHFYSVKYCNFGMSQPETAWFDNRADAVKFFDAVDSADSIRAHRVSRPESILLLCILVARFRD